MSVHLAIETAHRAGGVAVRGEDGRVVAVPLESASGIDDRLMPEIDRLFRELGATPCEVSLVGVSIGPGGFTGLRIAVSTARSLALTTGCAVVAVPTAIVAAAGSEATVAVLLSSRRGTIWCTRVAAGGQIDGEPGLVGTSGLAERIRGCEAVIADDHLPEDMAELLGDVPIRPLHLDPTACLEAAEAMAADGRTVDPGTLEPLYPRPPEAVRLFEAR
ncbi:MAG: tRNA (adenosine(37)-N6)-threonylcarbamoyltransferase complex dimerization subunit type 1 TsaB [Phycisphaerales bacterium]|nr:tRNA (adenosine(37)-N6)-threonylcarbamoyltransferase complex dimerization subunit type 1 TsaB [Phycisphaerales bacterium]